MESTKRFRLSESQIEPLATGHGSCFASDRITVDGLAVGYAYREAPDRASDSGWRFFGGDESQAYADDPSNFAIYDVNTIANYDHDIIPFLALTAPCEVERPADGGPLRKVQ